MDITAHLADTANALLFSSEMAIAIFNMTVLVGGRLDSRTKEVLIAWLVTALGYAFRIGFWLIAIKTAPDQLIQVCQYNAGVISDCVVKAQVFPLWALESRGWIIIAACMVVWGNVKYYCIVKGCSNRAFYGQFFGFILVISALNYFI